MGEGDKWSEIVCGKDSSYVYFVLGWLEQPWQDKNLLYHAAQRAQRTNQWRTPFIQYVLHVSQFSSVSTVSRGHPSLVSLVPMIPCFLLLATVGLVSSNTCPWTSIPTLNNSRIVRPWVYVKRPLPAWLYLVAPEILSLYPLIICWPLKLISRELGHKEEKGERGGGLNREGDPCRCRHNIFTSCKKGGGNMILLSYLPALFRWKFNDDPTTFVSSTVNFFKRDQ